MRLVLYYNYMLTVLDYKNLREVISGQTLLSGWTKTLSDPGCPTGGRSPGVCKSL